MCRHYNIIAITIATTIAVTKITFLSLAQSNCALEIKDFIFSEGEFIDFEYSKETSDVASYDKEDQIQEKYRKMYRHIQDRDLYDDYYKTAPSDHDLYVDPSFWETEKAHS